MGDDQPDEVSSQSNSEQDESHVIAAVQSDSSSDSEIISESKSQGISAISLASLKEDIEKGKAAKHQISKLFAAACALDM